MPEARFRRTAPRRPGGPRRWPRIRRWRVGSRPCQNAWCQRADSFGLRAAADEQNARDASAQGSDELQAVALGAQQSFDEARARFSRVVLARVMPEKVAVAFGRFGVRSPSKYGTRVMPPAPGFEAKASLASSS